MLSHIDEFENRSRVNEIIAGCLEKRFFMTCKPCWNLFYLWFRSSIKKVIFTSGFITEDDYSDILEIFLKILLPPYQTFNPKKGSALVFLTQLLKIAVLNFLRKKYKYTDRFVPIYDEHMFGNEQTYSIKRGDHAISKEIAFEIFDIIYRESSLELSANEKLQFQIKFWKLLNHHCETDSLNIYKVSRIFYEAISHRLEYKEVLNIIKNKRRDLKEAKK